MDMFFSKVKSKKNFTMMQLFVSDKVFVKVYRIKSETEVLNAVKLFCKEVGVSKAVIVDPSPSQTSDKVRQFHHKVGKTLCMLKGSIQHSDTAKLYIRLMKKLVGRDMRELNSPMKL